MAQATNLDSSLEITHLVDVWVQVTRRMVSLGGPSFRSGKGNNRNEHAAPSHRCSHHHRCLAIASGTRQLCQSMTTCQMTRLVLGHSLYSRQSQTNILWNTVVCAMFRYGILRGAEVHVRGNRRFSPRSVPLSSVTISILDPL